MNDIQFKELLELYINNRLNKLLENNNCTKCPFQKLEVIAFNQVEIIKSCTRCKEN